MPALFKRRTFNGARFRGPASYSQGAFDESDLIDLLQSSEFISQVGGQVSIDPSQDNYSVVFHILDASFDVVYANTELGDNGDDNDNHAIVLSILTF